jgi:hypothetical protein
MFKPSGEEMTEEAWQTGYACCLGVRWAGDLIADTDEKGEPVVGDTILLLLNAHHETISFTLPALKEGQQWERLLEDRRGVCHARTGGGPAAIYLAGPINDGAAYDAAARRRPGTPDDQPHAGVFRGDATAVLIWRGMIMPYDSRTLPLLSILASLLIVLVLL